MPQGPSSNASPHGALSRDGVNNVYTRLWTKHWNRFSRVYNIPRITSITHRGKVLKWRIQRAVKEREPQSPSERGSLTGRSSCSFFFFFFRFPLMQTLSLFVYWKALRPTELQSRLFNPFWDNEALLYPCRHRVGHTICPSRCLMCRYLLLSRNFRETSKFSSLTWSVTLIFVAKKILMLQRCWESTRYSCI